MRNFLHRRAQPHRIAARAQASSASQPAAPTSDVQTPNPITVPSPVVPASTQPPQSSAAPSSSPAPSSAPASPASSSPSASASASPSAPTSSASSASGQSSPAAASSSLSLATPSSASTPLVVSPQTTSNAFALTTQVVSGQYTPTSSLAPSASTTSTTSSGGTNTGIIIGAVAGTLVGIAILGFLLMWCMRRQRDQDVDEFDAQAFKRQSAVLVDDPVEPPQSHNPRPPSMIERHNASPALAAQSATGYPGQNFYGGYGGYGQQPAYPAEMVQNSVPPQQAYGIPPTGYAADLGYSSQQQLARQPSNAAYLTRQPSTAPGYPLPAVPPSTHDPNAHYIDLNRSSVSPYQAAQYAEISRQLGTSDPNGNVPHDSNQLPDGPLPSPFDDPSPSHPTTNAQGNTHHSSNTLYETGDPYGGI